ncbi:MAG TPA: ATP synthase F1 subunit delta [Candidatus Angelobacter sp.]|nr:ATP synthase F1 subunit delta [Candidatus Angelobacter sp.]
MASVAGRYARAFADVTADRKVNPDKAVAELGQMAELVTGNTEFRNVLQNPSVAHTQKLSLIDAIIKLTGGSQILRNFVAVLIDHRRIGQLGEIFEQFKQELDRRMGIEQARVSSARPLTEAEKKSLEKQLTAMTGKIVRATYAEDTSLLGGAVVRIGSTIYDGSVHGQLERIRQQIAGN